MPSSQIDLLSRLAIRLGLDSQPTRRLFLRTSAGTLVGMSATAALARAISGPPLVILENATGLLVADPTRCVGCRRCELACTEYHEGRAQPSLSRIKVGRNYNFGPRGAGQGVGRGAGQFGNLRIVQDTCRQCPHPVPCATACPSEAIVLHPQTKARIVDAAKCSGCRLCLAACPWEMISFDEARLVATKCFLCDGAPACVEACPASALRYVAWRDLTRSVPVRRTGLTVARTPDGAGCAECHRPRR